MPLSDLLAPNAIFPLLKVGNKKQMIQELSAQAAKLTGSDERKIFEILLQRERLGSTGNRPRRRDPARQAAEDRTDFRICSRDSRNRSISRRSTASRSISCFFCWRRRRAGADHLKALALIARLLRDSNIAKKLRNSRDASSLYAILTMPPATNAA